MARNGRLQRGAERFHPGAYRRGHRQVECLSAVVDGVVSSQRIVGELRAWRSGSGDLSARIERRGQFVCGRQERGALYRGACAGRQSVRSVKGKNGFAKFPETLKPKRTCLKRLGGSTWTPRRQKNGFTYR